MTSLDAAIRARLDDPIDVALNGTPYVEALRSVLDMMPPSMDDLVPDAHERAQIRVGWIAAKAQAVSAIALALGVDVPGGGS